MAFLVSYQYVFQSTASTRRSIGREFRWHAIVCLVPGLCRLHYCASMHQVTTGVQVKRIRVRAFFPFLAIRYVSLGHLSNLSRFTSALLDAFPGKPTEEFPVLRHQQETVTMRCRMKVTYLRVMSLTRGRSMYVLNTKPIYNNNTNGPENHPPPGVCLSTIDMSEFRVYITQRDPLKTI